MTVWTVYRLIPWGGDYVKEIVALFDSEEKARAEQKESPCYQIEQWEVK